MLTKPRCGVLICLLRYKKSVSFEKMSSYKEDEGFRSSTFNSKQKSQDDLFVHLISFDRVQNLNYLEYVEQQSIFLKISKLSLVYSIYIVTIFLNKLSGVTRKYNTYSKLA
jgi:hypothetical protein